MTNIDTTATPATKTRRKVTESNWIDESGRETKEIKEAAGVQIEVLGQGHFEILFDDLEPAVQKAGRAFGIKTVLTNAIGGLAGSEAYEAFAGRLEVLQSGEWREGRGEGGPRISQLAQAVVDAFTKAAQTAVLDGLVDRFSIDLVEGENGVERTHLAGVSAWLKDGGEELRKQVSSQTPAIQVELRRIQREAAEKREAEAAKAAAESGGLDSLMGAMV